MMERKKGEAMIPVQYRDAETEETLERRYEAEAPGIGDGVVVGVERCEVL